MDRPYKSVRLADVPESDEDSNHEGFDYQDNLHVKRYKRLRLKKPQDIRLFGYIPSYNRWKLKRKKRHGPNDVGPALRYPDVERKYMLDERVEIYEDEDEYILDDFTEAPHKYEDEEDIVFPENIDEERLGYLRQRFKMAAKAAVQVGRLTVGMRNPMIVEIQGRTVSQYWFDKFLILFDYLQFMAMFTVMTRHWMPHWWSSWTEFTLWFNLDLIGFREQFVFLEIFGSSVEFLWIFYVAFFATIPIILLICHFRVKRWYRVSVKRSSLASVPKMLRERALRQRALWVAADFLYLPVLLALFRVLHFSAFDSTCYMSFDARLGCTDWQVFVAAVPMIFIGVPFLIALPLMYHRYVAKELIHHIYDKQEVYYQTKEMEYLLGINRDWVHRHFFLHSSYRRPWGQMRFRRMVQKALLVFCFVLSGDSEDTGSWGMRVKTYGYGVVFLVPFAYALWEHPFRVRSSTWMNNWLGWVMAFDIFYASLLGEGLENPLTIASNALIILIIINVTGIFVWIQIPILLMFWSAKRRWKVTRATIRNITRSEDDYELLDAVQRALSELDRAVKQLRRVPEMVDPVPLEREIVSIRSYWVKAKGAHHTLEVTLADLLEDLVDVYDESMDHTLLPYPPFEEVAQDFADRLHHRDVDMLLTSRVKKRILLKMFAVSVFMRLVRRDSDSDADSVIDIHDILAKEGIS